MTLNEVIDKACEGLSDKDAQLVRTYARYGNLEATHYLAEAFEAKEGSFSKKCQWLSDIIERNRVELAKMKEAFDLPMIKQDGKFYYVSFKSFGRTDCARTLDEAKEIERTRKLELRYIYLKAKEDLRRMEAYQQFVLAKKGRGRTSRMTLHIDRQGGVDVICVSVDGYSIQIDGRTEHFSRHHTSELTALLEAVHIYTARREHESD